MDSRIASSSEIERAEKLPFTAPPYYFVKTQFGSVQGHVAIVYLLDALKTRYFSNLYVNDESDFYEHRDPQMVADKMRSGSSGESDDPVAENDAWNEPTFEEEVEAMYRLFRVR